MKPVLLAYFVRRIALAVMLLWVALAVLLVFFELLRKADDFALATAFALALLNAPRLAMETLPFACAIGCALAMRRMVDEGEMPALRTAGLSPTAIVIFQLAAALPFVLIYILLSEAVMPSSATLARTLQNINDTADGLWLADEEDYIRIKTIDSSGTMLSVVIYHTDDNALVGITHAERAMHDGDGWLLLEVTHISNDGTTLNEKVLPRQQWQLPMQPSSFSAMTRKPRDMALADAMRAANELAAAGQHNNNLQKTIWQRWLTLPALLLLCAFGVSFIGGSARRRYALSLPVLLATFTAGIYFVARDIAIQSATISDTPLLLFLPPLLLAAAVTHSLRRAAMV